MTRPDPRYPERPADLRLVVADMDGTLLDDAGDPPAGFTALLRRMHAAGVVFVPASGRQLATLRHMFDDAAVPVDTYIAENGNVVAHHGAVVDSAAIDPAAVAAIIDAVRAANAAGADITLVRCHADRAYAERLPEGVAAELAKYYRNHAVVDDLHALAGDVVKLAAYEPLDAEARALPTLAAAAPATLRTVVSGAHWVDMMDPARTKGTAVAALRDRLGVPASAVAIFGDYLNDLEMMAEGGLSFAMANAHPEILAAARYVAPANDRAGVVVAVNRLLDRLGR